jgi:hypothetical protein
VRNVLDQFVEMQLTCCSDVMLDEYDLGTPCDEPVIPGHRILERLIPELDLGPPLLERTMS